MDLEKNTSKTPGCILCTPSSFYPPMLLMIHFLASLFTRRKRNKKTDFKESANQNDVEQKAEVEHIGQKLRRGSWNLYTSHTSRTWKATKPFWIWISVFKCSTVGSCGYVYPQVFWWGPLVWINTHHVHRTNGLLWNSYKGKSSFLMLLGNESLWLW